MLRSGWCCCIRRDSSRWSSFWPTRRNFICNKDLVFHKPNFRVWNTFSRWRLSNIWGIRQLLERRKQHQSQRGRQSLEQLWRHLSAMSQRLWCHSQDWNNWGRSEVKRMKTVAKVAFTVMREGFVRVPKHLQSFSSSYAFFRPVSFCYKSWMITSWLAPLFFCEQGSVPGEHPKSQEVQILNCHHGLQLFKIYYKTLHQHCPIRRPHAASEVVLSDPRCNKFVSRLFQFLVFL